ncbi:MAG TPA: hypothetical protein VNT60_09210 [Deinococcales bacterium]|nr:hypothetical protein [Deinococcales bacterium]
MAQGSYANDDINLSRAAAAVKASLLPIIAVAILAGAAAYGVTRNGTPEYQATASLLQTGTQLSGATAISQQAVAPAALPPEALRQALSSSAVLNSIRARLGEVPGLTTAERERLSAALRDDATRGLETLDVKGQPDAFGNGTYTLSANAADPEAAAGLTNLAARTLIEWDRNRAVDSLRSLRAAVQAELNAVNAQLQSARGSTAEFLTVRRNDLTSRISDLNAQERSTSSVLTLLRPAVAPTDPIKPTPVRNAILAGLLGAFFTAAYVMLRQLGSRTVDSANDLRGLDLRLLGSVPRVRSGRGAAVLAAVSRGPAAEAVARLRYSLLSVLGKGKPKVILVTSASAGEGKTTITGALGNSFSAAGQKVLVVDADGRRAGQNNLWSRVAPGAEWVPLPGSDPFPTEEARDLKSAVLRPDAAQAKRLRENLHLLPAGAAGAAYTDEQLATALRTWSVGYDVVLIDSPPAEATADALMLASLSDGILMVLEPGQVSVDSLERVLDGFSLSDARVLGVVFNKSAAQRSYASAAPAVAVER